jgi:hypothetical protein
MPRRNLRETTRIPPAIKARAVPGGKAAGRSDFRQDRKTLRTILIDNDSQLAYIEGVPMASLRGEGRK